MAVVNIKLSQAAVNKDNELGSNIGNMSLGNFAGEVFSERQNAGELTYNASSMKIKGNQFTFTYPNGIQKVLTGSYTLNSDMLGGTGTATESTITIPKQIKEIIEGTLNFEYTLTPIGSTGNYTLTIADTGGEINAYLVESLATDATYGKMSMGFTSSNGLDYNADMDLSGAINTLTMTGTKHIKSVTLGGNFNVTGNNFGDATPNVNGQLTSYNMTYVDKSVIDIQQSPILANSNTVIDRAAFANAANWIGADEFTVDLPKTLYEAWVINSGNGADKLTLKGGGGMLSANAGEGDDYVILLDNAPVVDGGNGNDTLEIHFTGGLDMAGVSNFEKLVLGGKAAINGTGDAGNNTITGNDGKNTLDGGAGTDTLIGGKGDDTYIVRSTNDVVIEDENGGKKDHVMAYVSYTLSDFTESLTLMGTDDINATGNTAKNVLIGNNGNNTLDGGGGIDTLTGGIGDDVYIVRDAKDKVTEKKDGGHDRIETTVNKYTIGNLAEIEDLSFIGTGNATLTGNAKTNVLIGSTGNDTLDGGKGGDTLIGGDGDDVYYIDDLLDVVTEQNNEGHDTVYSSVNIGALWDNVEDLILTGKALNATGNDRDNLLIGTSAANTLSGLDGNDIIDGLGGNDRYIGGNGADAFRLSLAPNAKSNVKTIQDFVSGEDSIDVNAKTFKWKGDLGQLLEENFGSNETGLAETADQRFIYNETNGQLFYDADGSGKGKAVLMAVLEGSPDLLFSDINLYDPTIVT